jgi:hypothetical protein
MTYQGWDVQLTAYAARDRRANFFPVGAAHSIVGGFGVGADAVASGHDHQDHRVHWYSKYHAPIE